MVLNGIISPNRNDEVTENTKDLTYVVPNRLRQSMLYVTNVIIIIYLNYL